MSITLAATLTDLNKIFCNYNFTKEDFHNPRRVQEIYGLFLNEFNICSKPSSARMIQSSDPGIVQHPEVMDMSLLDLLSRMLYLFGCLQEQMDFELSDLFAPEIKRTTKFVWQLSNLFLYINFGYDNVQLVQDKVKSKVDKRSEKESRLLELQGLIKSQRELIGSQKMEEEKNLKEVQELEDLVQELYQGSSVLQEQVKQIQSKILEEKTELQQIALGKKDLMEEQERLKLCSREQDDILKHQETIAIQEDAKSEKNKRKVVLSRELRVRTEKLSNFNYILSQVENLRQTAGQLSETYQKTKQCQWLMDDLKNQSEDLQSQIRKLQEKEEDISTQTKSFIVKWNKKKQFKNAELAEYSNKIQSMQRGLNEEEVISNELNQDISAFCDTIEQLNIEWKNLDKKINLQFFQILDETQKFTEFVEEDFKKLHQRVKKTL